MQLPIHNESLTKAVELLRRIGLNVGQSEKVQVVACPSDEPEENINFRDVSEIYFFHDLSDFDRPGSFDDDFTYIHSFELVAKTHFDRYIHIKSRIKQECDSCDGRNSGTSRIVYSKSLKSLVEFCFTKKDIRQKFSIELEPKKLFLRQVKQLKAQVKWKTMQSYSLVGHNDQ